jgi:hypothetical protein
VIADLGFIPANIGAVLVARPADLAAVPDLKQFIDGFKELKEMETRIGVKLTDVEQVAVVWNYTDNGQRRSPVPEPSGVFVRTLAPVDWKKVVKQSGAPEMVETTVGDTPAYSFGPPNSPALLAFPNDRTLVGGESSMVRRMLGARPGALARPSPRGRPRSRSTPTGSSAAPAAQSPSRARPPRPSPRSSTGFRPTPWAST